MSTLRPRRFCRAGALSALGLLVLLGLAACRKPEPPPPPPEEGLLTLEQPYTRQKLARDGKADYRFHARSRGAYLIMVYGNPAPLRITLRHPKKTCYLLGNGSCELVTGPDERYDFQVFSDSGDPAEFSVMVTHSEGRGRFEGEVTQPRALRPNTEHEGTVGVRESSYYTFTAAAGGPHTIAISGARSDLLWRLFDAPEFDVILQECDGQAGAADEACQTQPLHAGMRYYVKVEERSGVPGPYRLTIYGP